MRKLLPLIERYFDCDLSDKEERELRVAIAATTLVHPAIDEARAVMGVRRVTSKRHRSGVRTRAIVSAAASLLLVFALGYSLLRFTPGRSDDVSRCIAYAHGEKITDEDEILRLIATDLREASTGTGDEVRSFEEELGDVAPIIDSFETIIIME